ncbi:divalent-cation tolerance protein CutA [Microlunatus elymi]|uniref:Divalent-cation tolerance protein CutA n=1 Tax=Microlunatus elymi TaxID=2596828 RepID=A0A516PUX8_9ACTN|nr:divalent-cation tolerance protein CutA [Microlunatus elymi]QDP94994.1 divalent-cation tolerance protein CutA [Microlunatus elymi]
MTDQPDICEVVITAPDEAWLLAFTRQLVERRLAACGHHASIRSIYTWQHSIEAHQETRVALHTRAEHVPAIIETTNNQHPYEVPCVIATPIIHANPEYAQWIIDSTNDPT